MITEKSSSTSEKVTLPNFLIVGAAKCGTSSLAYYLQQHPEIFISENKEPRFITSRFQPYPLGGPKDEGVERWVVRDFQKYSQLFEKATEPAIGEASADTLYYYDRSIPVIKEYFGNPKIIIILRDPVKRAFSAYQHLVRDNREHLPLREALLKEPERIAANYELIYYYTDVSRYFNSVNAFMEAFTDVKIILNEDLQRNTAATLYEIFRFLNVDITFEADTSIQHNPSGVPRSRLLHTFLFEKNPVRKVLKPFTRTLLSRKTREKLNNRLMARNLKRISFSQEEEALLRPLFRKDVEQLQVLLGRDLSRWL